MASRMKHARLPRPIRLTLPVSVAFDLEKFQQALANVAQLLRAPKRQPEISFLQAREFVVDATSLEAREAAP